VNRTRVGSPFVIDAMTRAAASGQTVVGFEANGGVMLGTTIRRRGREVTALPTRDAVLPILSVLGLALETGRSLSQLVATLPARSTRSGRIEEVEDIKGQGFLGLLGPQFFEDLGQVESESGIDGRRFTFAGGDVIHFRQSGNAPELRCYTESSSPERAEALLSWGLQAARFVLGV
jgi:phosphomannomutase